MNFDPNFQPSGTIESESILPVVLNGLELNTLSIKPRAMILSPWLPEKGVAMISASRGIGKTWLALNIACVAATGNEFLGWKAPKPVQVLYLDGEMPLATLQERFRKIIEPHGDNFPFERFRLLAADHQERGIPSLATEEGQQFIEFEASAADLIIVDNIATLCTTGKENDTDKWTPVQSWALRQRAKNRSVLFIHHMGKGNDQRGTSAREDILDTSIKLSRPPGYDPTQGARFEVHYSKARGFFGPDAEPFEARYDGTQWVTGPIQVSDDPDALRTLSKEGYSVRDIAKRTGMSKSAVNRRLNAVG
jgi:AAA domain/Winged helix-turn-helix DNA-binding